MVQLHAPEPGRRLRSWGGYYLSGGLFVAGVALLWCGCAAAAAWPDRAKRERVVRLWIRGLLRAWVWWLGAARLVRCDRSRWPQQRGPAVYAANHPSLIDATILLAQLPEAVCLVKPALRRHPLLGLPLRLAGYVAADEGVDSLRGLAQRLRTGVSVVIFPEGTRTAAAAVLNPLKAGFALVARRAGVPVQLLVIRCSLLPKGWDWWLAPPLPGEWSVAAAGTVPVAESQLAAIVADTELRLREALTA